MKSILMSVFAVVVSLYPVGAWTAKPRLAAPKLQKQQKPARKLASKPKNDLFKVAIASYKNRDYPRASRLFFQLVRKNLQTNQAAKYRYFLGETLLKMKLNQVAAYQYLDVIKRGDGEYRNKARLKLFRLSHELNSDSFLEYLFAGASSSGPAISGISKPLLGTYYFRLGEFHIRKRQYVRAIDAFLQVEESSPQYLKALYSLGRSFAELKRFGEGRSVFEKIIDLRKNRPVPDIKRDTAQMGIARIFYDEKKFEDSARAFRLIPRDSEVWHEALPEISWAYLRTGNYRSVLSVLHSLHSAYYDSYLVPESVMLRSFVYLFLCHYEEMEKTLSLFLNIYRPMQISVVDFMKSHTQYEDYYFEITSSTPSLPVPVVHNVKSSADFMSVDSYLDKLKKEMKTFAELSSSWQKSPLGEYAHRLLEQRNGYARRSAGKQIRNQLLNIRKTFAQMFRQYDFASYELSSARKKFIKEEIVRKNFGLSSDIENQSRDLLIENGIEYWPYEGEYWLDEIGNYHSLGSYRCGDRKN